MSVPKIPSAGFQREPASCSVTARPFPRGRHAVSGIRLLRAAGFKGESVISPQPPGAGGKYVCRRHQHPHQPVPDHSRQGRLYAATGLATYLCAAIAIALPPETTPAAVAFRFRWFGWSGPALAAAPAGCVPSIPSPTTLAAATPDCAAPNATSPDALPAPSPNDATPSPVPSRTSMKPRHPSPAILASHSPPLRPYSSHSAAAAPPQILQPPMFRQYSRSR